MMGRRNSLSVTKRSLRNAESTVGKRPRRVVQSKILDDTVGLSRQEEQELNKALYASLQENRRNRSFPGALGNDSSSSSTSNGGGGGQMSSSKSSIISNQSSIGTSSRNSSSSFRPNKRLLGQRRSLRTGVSSPKHHLRPSSSALVSRAKKAKSALSFTSRTFNPTLSSNNNDDSSQDSVRSSTSSANGSKRKIHAQRKFAQGCSLPGTPSCTPIKSATPPAKLMSFRIPKTEDFLTFLCLRGSSVLPPHLDFFNFSREVCDEGQRSTSSAGKGSKQQRESTTDSSSISSGANEEVAEAASVSTPSPTGRGGNSLLAKRSAARASAGTPETARGIVSLRQGLQRKVSTSSSSSSSARFPVSSPPSRLSGLTNSSLPPGHRNCSLPPGHRKKFYFTPEKSPSPSKASGIRPGEFTPPSLFSSTRSESSYFSTPHTFSPLANPSVSQKFTPLHSSSGSQTSRGSSSSYSSTSLPSSAGASKRKHRTSQPSSNSSSKVIPVCPTTSSPSLSVRKHSRLDQNECLSCPTNSLSSRPSIPSPMSSSCLASHLSRIGPKSSTVVNDTTPTFPETFPQGNQFNKLPKHTFATKLCACNKLLNSSESSPKVPDQLNSLMHPLSQHAREPEAQNLSADYATQRQTHSDTECPRGNFSECYTNNCRFVCTNMSSPQCGCLCVSMKSSFHHNTKTGFVHGCCLPDSMSSVCKGCSMRPQFCPNNHLTQHFSPSASCDINQGSPSVHHVSCGASHHAAGCLAHRDTHHAVDDNQLVYHNNRNGVMCHTRLCPDLGKGHSECRFNQVVSKQIHTAEVQLAGRYGEKCQSQRRDGERRQSKRRSRLILKRSKTTGPEGHVEKLPTLKIRLLHESPREQSGDKWGVIISDQRSHDMSAGWKCQPRLNGANRKYILRVNRAVSQRVRKIREHIRKLRCNKTWQKFQHVSKEVSAPGGFQTKSLGAFQTEFLKMLVSTGMKAQDESKLHFDHSCEQNHSKTPHGVDTKDGGRQNARAKEKHRTPDRVDSIYSGCQKASNKEHHKMVSIMGEDKRHTLLQDNSFCDINPSQKDHSLSSKNAMTETCLYGKSVSPQIKKVLIKNGFNSHRDELMSKKDKSPFVSVKRLERKKSNLRYKRSNGVTLPSADDLNLRERVISAFAKFNRRDIIDNNIVAAKNMEARDAMLMAQQVFDITDISVAKASDKGPVDLGGRGTAISQCVGQLSLDPVDALSHHSNNENQKAKGENSKITHQPDAGNVNTSHASPNDSHSEVTDDSLVSRLPTEIFNRGISSKVTETHETNVREESSPPISAGLSALTDMLTTVGLSSQTSSYVMTQDSAQSALDLIKGVLSVGEVTKYRNKQIQTNLCSIVGHDGLSGCSTVVKPSVIEQACVEKFKDCCMDPLNVGSEKRSKMSRDEVKATCLVSSESTNIGVDCKETKLNLATSLDDCLILEKCFCQEEVVKHLKTCLCAVCSLKYCHQKMFPHQKITLPKKFHFSYVDSEGLLVPKKRILTDPVKSFQTAESHSLKSLEEKPQVIVVEDLSDCEETMHGLMPESKATSSHSPLEVQEPNILVKEMKFKKGHMKIDPQAEQCKNPMPLVVENKKFHSESGLRNIEKRASLELGAKGFSEKYVFVKGGNIRAHLNKSNDKRYDQHIQSAGSSQTDQQKCNTGLVHQGKNGCLSDVLDLSCPKEKSLNAFSTTSFHNAPVVLDVSRNEKKRGSSSETAVTACDIVDNDAQADVFIIEDVKEPVVAESVHDSAIDLSISGQSRSVGSDQTLVQSGNKEATIGQTGRNNVDPGLLRVSLGDQSSPNQPPSESPPPSSDKNGISFDLMEIFEWSIPQNKSIRAAMPKSLAVEDAHSTRISGECNSRPLCREPVSQTTLVGGKENALRNVEVNKDRVKDPQNSRERRKEPISRAKSDGLTVKRKECLKSSSVGVKESKMRVCAAPRNSLVKSKSLDETGLVSFGQSYGISGFNTSCLELEARSRSLGSKPKVPFNSSLAVGETPTREDLEVQQRVNDGHVPIVLHSYGSLNTGQGFALVNGQLQHCKILDKKNVISNNGHIAKVQVQGSKQPDNSPGAHKHKGPKPDGPSLTSLPAHQVGPHAKSQLPAFINPKRVQEAPLEMSALDMTTSMLVHGTRSSDRPMPSSIQDKDTIINQATCKPTFSKINSTTSDCSSRGSKSSHEKTSVESNQSKDNLQPSSSITTHKQPVGIHQRRTLGRSIYLRHDSTEKESSNLVNFPLQSSFSASRGSLSKSLKYQENVSSNNPLNSTFDVTWSLPDFEDTSSKNPAKSVSNTHSTLSRNTFCNPSAISQLSLLDSLSISRNMTQSEQTESPTYCCPNTRIEPVPYQHQHVALAAPSAHPYTIQRSTISDQDPPTTNKDFLGFSQIPSQYSKSHKSHAPVSSIGQHPYQYSEVTCRTESLDLMQGSPRSLADPKQGCGNLITLGATFSGDLVVQGRPHPKTQEKFNSSNMSKGCDQTSEALSDISPASSLFQTTGISLGSCCPGKELQTQLNLNVAELMSYPAGVSLGRPLDFEENLNRLQLSNENVLDVIMEELQVQINILKDEIINENQKQKSVLPQTSHLPSSGNSSHHAAPFVDSQHLAHITSASSVGIPSQQGIVDCIEIHSGSED